MIQSFMQYIYSGSQQKINEAIDSFNDDISDQTAIAFKDYLDGINNPQRKFVKVLDFQNSQEIQNTYNLSNECGIIDTDVVIVYGQEYTTEQTVQNYISDLQAGQDQGHSLDISMKCMKVNQHGSKCNFFAIHDTDTNIVFICINAEYDDAEQIVELAKDTIYTLTGSRNMNNAALRLAITELSETTAMNGNQQSRKNALKLLLQFVTYHDKQDFLQRRWIQELLNDQNVAPAQAQANQQNQVQNNAQATPAQAQANQQNQAQNNAQTQAAPAATTINGIQILGQYDNQARDATYNVILSKWPADSTEFRNFVNRLDPAAAACFAERPVRVKAVEFTSTDTLIRRLWIVLFDSNNNMTFFTTTNGHPMVLKVAVPSAVFTSVSTQNSDTWRKTFWAGWQRAFNQSPNGVTLLWDRDNFYNRKFHLNITCPANVGRAVNGPGRVDATNGGGNAAAAPAGNAQQQAGNAQTPRQRQPRAGQVADTIIQQVQTSVDQQLASTGNDDIHVVLAINRNHRPKGCPKDANTYFVVTFPGLEQVTMIDAEARAFLEDLDLWQNVIEPGYNVAAQQFDGIKLCVSMDRSFIQQ